MADTLTDITGVRQKAQASIEDLSNLQASSPGILADLKKNLTSVFAKDNPMIAKREGYLADYLSSGAKTRASMLPSNLPVVAGSPLNLSPTQQASIESGRSAAAFAPLASINQLITGEYGTLGDLLTNAASIFQNQIEAAKLKTAGYGDLYKTMIAEQEANRKASESGLDFSSILTLLKLLQGGGQTESATDFSIDAFLEPDPQDVFGANGLSYGAGAGPGLVGQGGQPIDLSTIQFLH